MKYRNAFSESDADGDTGSGKSSAAGRVDGGGLTSPASDLAGTEDGVRREYGDGEGAEEARFGLDLDEVVLAYRRQGIYPNLVFGVTFWRPAWLDREPWLELHSNLCENIIWPTIGENAALTTLVDDVADLRDDRIVSIGLQGNAT